MVLVCFMCHIVCVCVLCKVKKSGCDSRGEDITCGWVQSKVAVEGESV